MALDLSGFTGSEFYFRYTRSVVLTDGAAYLAKEGKCYWLFDVIVSYLSKLPQGESFAVAVLKKNADASAVFRLVDDLPSNNIYAEQRIAYTDFELDEIKLYICRNEAGFVVMLPSEY